MKRNKFIISLLLLTVFAAGCMDVKNRKTSLEITDNNRHYYPILQGDILTIDLAIKNTGEVPFMLTDMYTSCGCLTTDDSNIDIIPQGKQGRLILKYNSNKNIGYVKHYVTLYGNLQDSNRVEIAFDVHVVPSSLNTKDYEELYRDTRDWTDKDNDLTRGKGYYLDQQEK